MPSPRSVVMHQGKCFGSRNVLVYGSHCAGLQEGSPPSPASRGENRLMFARETAACKSPPPAWQFATPGSNPPVRFSPAGESTLCANGGQV